MPPVEVFQNFAQLPSHGVGIETQHSVDNVVCPRFVSRIEIPRFCRRFEWPDHDPRRVRFEL
jgi:hypothetical protein